VSGGRVTINPVSEGDRRYWPNEGAWYESSAVLPDLTMGRPIVAYGAVTGPASYAAGGFTFDLPGGGTLSEVIVSPRGGYTFEFDGTSKCVGYTAPGAEVAPATDLSIIGPIPYQVLSQRDQNVYALSLAHASLLSKAELVVAEDVAGSVTDYVTVWLQLVRAASGDVELFGSVTSSPKGLTSSTRYALFEALGPSRVAQLRSGDYFRLRVEGAGVVPSLVSPRVIFRMRRP